MKLAYIDASVWIAYVEGITSYQKVARTALRKLRQDGWLPCISEVVILETQCKPYREKNEILIATYDSIFSTLTCFNVFGALFKDALLLSQKENLKPMDAVHLSFATKYGCSRLVTTDPHFKSITTVTPLWIDLSQVAPNPH